MASKRFTDNTARKALWVRLEDHEYFKQLAKSEDKMQAQVVHDAVGFLKAMRYGTKMNYLPLSDETWALFSRFDIERTPEEIIRELILGRER